MDPMGLNDSCIDSMILGLLRALDPIGGVYGPYRFEEQVHRFDDFGVPPRALIIILKKARGGPEARLARPRSL